MRKISLSEIEKVLHPEIISSVNQTFSGIGTDTRASLKGMLFIALVGESFDPHTMLDKAVEAGAAGILIHDHVSEVQKYKDKISIFKVPNTLKALQALGKWAKSESGSKVIGITGSNGKTTTKEFSAAIIGATKKVHFNKGSFNNHWGVPFTLLQIPNQTEISLVEMGMNHAGEIAQLVSIAEPDVVICTMVGRAHIEFFGSIDKIAEAKHEIYAFSKPEAIRVYNLDNPQTLKMYEQDRRSFAKARFITFSEYNSDADVYFKLKSSSLKSITISGHIKSSNYITANKNEGIGSIKDNLAGSISDKVVGEKEVFIFGEQNLTNLMAASALALAAGLTPQQIWDNLQKCKTNWGRNQLVDIKNESQMLFDAYNANPDSMQALIDNVKKINITGKKIGLFGEMRELGEMTAYEHEQLGEKVAEGDFSSVFFVGPSYESFKKGLMRKDFSKNVYLCTDFEKEIAMRLSQIISTGDLLVVKGSRGMRLERFVEFLEPKNFEKDK